MLNRINEIANYLDTKMKDVRFGEISATIRVQDGRPTIVELTTTEKYREAEKIGKHNEKYHS
jgi:hypothetical protein